MGTRLRYEQMIKNEFPNIEYLRAYSPGNYQAIIYAGDITQNLDSETEIKLLDFFKVSGQAHLEHIIKPYSNLFSDNVPPVDDPPDEIKVLALAGGLNVSGIKESVNLAFPFLDVQMVKVEKETIYFTLPEDKHLTNVEWVLINQYMHEIIPLNARAKFI